MADEVDLKPVYLIAGSDTPKVKLALQRLRVRFGSDAIEAHTATELTGDDAVAACNALGLFAGEGRLVVITEVEAWKAEDAKAVAGYLKAPVLGTTLALVGGELKKDSPVAKSVATAGEVLLWDVEQRKLHPWVAAQFKRRSTPAEPEACRLLVELVGSDLHELAGEVDKLSTWADGERVTEADVEMLVAPRAEGSNFALTDAWGLRDVPGVLAAYESLLEHTHEPASRTVPRIAAILTSHVSRIRECQALEAEGLSAKDAAARMKRSPYYVQKLYQQARGFSREELQDVTVRLAELDHALKGGSRLSGELELVRALVDVTAPHAVASH